jgi:hypothetical protein
MRRKKTALAGAAATWLVENWSNQIVPHAHQRGKVVNHGA